MKRLLATLAASLLMAMPAFCLTTQKTNTVNLVLDNVCDGSFNDFRFQLSGYDDQVFDFNYDVTLTGVAASFRITKPIEGTIYLDVPITNVTVSGTNVHFSIARTNIPPPGSYYGELLSYESSTTNIYRSLAQGKLPITWSLYLNETNYFARSTTNASIGQVYVHPSWIDPPWLSTSAAIGSIYFTIANSAALSNWTDVINTKATNNATNIITLQTYTNKSHTAYIWGNHATNGYITNTTETLWPAVSNTVTVNAANGATAYGWGDHSTYGYLTGTTNRFTDLYAADFRGLGTNISGLTQLVYTGSLTSVGYTGVTVMTVGRTYAMGYSHVGSGTSTLSIAGQSISKSAAGNYSNYFTYNGTNTNLVLILNGTGLAIGNVSNVHVKQITNGNISAANDLLVGGNIYADGALFQNPAAATNSMTLRIIATEGATGVLNSATGSLNGAVGALQGATNTLQGQATALAGATTVLNSASTALQGATNALQLQATAASDATNHLALTKLNTNDATFLTILQSMTNYVSVASSSNYLVYNPVTRLLTGCATNQGGGGTGSGFPLTNNVDLAGFSMTNGSFVGNGAGLTNVPGIETNYMAFHGESNVSIRVNGTNAYWGVPAVDGLKGATGVLNTATGSLNIAVTALNGATNVINIAVTNNLYLQSLTNSGFNSRVLIVETGKMSQAAQVATNTAIQTQATALQGATGVLNLASTALQGATNALQLQATAASGATNSLQVQATAASGATNALQTQSTALQGATNAVNIVANAALPKAGGTMSGNINLGGSYMPTNASYFGFSNSVAIKVGQLSGTNGVYFFNAANGSNYWILLP